MPRDGCSEVLHLDMNESYSEYACEKEKLKDLESPHASSLLQEVIEGHCASKDWLRDVRQIKSKDRKCVVSLNGLSQCSS